MSLELDGNLRKKIEKRRRAERDSRIWRRLTAMLWLAEGITEEEVAARLGVSARQVRKWLKIYRTHGLDALCQLNYQGRTPRLTDPQIDQLKEEIAVAVHMVESTYMLMMAKHRACEYVTSG